MTPEQIAQCVLNDAADLSTLRTAIAAAIAAERARIDLMRDDIMTLGQEVGRERAAREKAEAERDECRAAQEIRAKAIRDAKAEARKAREAALREAAAEVDCGCPKKAELLSATNKAERWYACPHPVCGAENAADILALIDKEPATDG